MSWFGWVTRLFGIGQAVETLQEQATRWVARYGGLGIQIALFVPASISLFFVGLFLSVGGLEYFLLIDKQSMLASLFLYAAVLSSITMIVTFVPRIFMTGFFVWIARTVGLMGFSIYIIGLEYTILLALPAGCILLCLLLTQGRNRPRSEVLQDLGLLKLVTSLLLLCCLTFGYLRGDHLREQPASMIIHLVDAKQPPLRVTVIMSFGQGVLVFAAPNAEPRLVPWDRIASIASVPSQGGISQRLRDWRDAVRSWIRSSPHR